MSAPEDFKRDDWLTLPSGKLVSVRGMSQSGDVTLRYVNDDGALANGEFQMGLKFLQDRAKKVERHDK